MPSHHVLERALDLLEAATPEMGSDAPLAIAIMAWCEGQGESNVMLPSGIVAFSELDPEDLPRIVDGLREEGRAMRGEGGSEGQH